MAKLIQNLLKYAVIPVIVWRAIYSEFDISKRIKIIRYDLFGCGSDYVGIVRKGSTTESPENYGLFAI